MNLFNRSVFAALLVLTWLITGTAAGWAQPNTPVEPYVSNTPLTSFPKAKKGKNDDAPPLRGGGTAPVSPHAAHSPDPLWLQETLGAASGALGVTPDEFAIANPNFPGISGGSPPDTNGAVGPNHYIQTSNAGRAYQIWDKQGTSLAGQCRGGTGKKLSRILLKLLRLCPAATASEAQPRDAQRAPAAAVPRSYLIRN